MFKYLKKFRFFRYVKWRLTHEHVWHQCAAGTWFCIRHFPEDGTRCGEWYGEQAWI